MANLNLHNYKEILTIIFFNFNAYDTTVNALNPNQYNECSTLIKVVSA